MRGVSVSDLYTVVNNYNTNVADHLTPAGQLLVADGLFTAQQLGAGNGLCVNNPSGAATGAACAVAPLITYTNPTTGLPTPGVIPGEVGLTWLKTFDMRLS
jgi:hypothetical protein